MSFKSKIIVLEGCDGVGKTTMMEDLKEEIKAIDPKIKLLTISLPCPRSFGYKKIKDILKGDWNYPTDLVQSLFLINVIDTHTRFINPFLEANPEDAIVIMDRSIISTILYNAVQGGSIFTAMTYFLRKARGEGNTNIPADDSEFNFDIINKEYGQLNHDIDFVFILNPPIDVVVRRAKERLSSERNDTVSIVKRMHTAYNTFYTFLTGHMYRTIIDMIEGPEKILRSNEAQRGKFYLLEEWNPRISDEENHATLRKKVLSLLDLSK